MANFRHSQITDEILETGKIINCPDIQTTNYFENFFHLLNHEFFCQVLQQIAFGPKLLQLIRTFFVLNNGFATDLFPVIQWGKTRQLPFTCIVYPHIGNTHGMSNWR